MLFSDALEVAIGLTFVFLLMSLVMTAVQETIESLQKRRGYGLYLGIVEMMGDPTRRAAAEAAAQKVYEHPLIQSLYREGFAVAKAARKLPSYIPARNFALAVIDRALKGELDPAPATNASAPLGASPGERLRLAAERIESAPLRRVVTQAVALGGGDLDLTQKHLESWYDSTMDRVSGRYRRRTQMVLFLVGLGTAIFLNVNTLLIADGLAENAALRRVIANRADVYGAAAVAAVTPVAAPTVTLPAAPGAPPEPQGARDELRAIEKLGLPIGWTAQTRSALARPLASDNALLDLVGLIQIFAGWLMTAFAITLGAPFWFDLLNRLMVVRATVKPHEKSPEESSQDHQEKPAAASHGMLLLDTSGAFGPARSAEPAPRVKDDDPVVGEIDPAERPREEDA